MSNEIKKNLINVQMLFDTGEISRKIARIQEEYEAKVAPKPEAIMGHSLSRKSFAGFTKAVKMNIDEDFRQYLNRLMYEKDVTQSTISRRSLILDTTLSRYINGSRDIPGKTIFRIALSLKLNLIETETLLRKKGKAFGGTKTDAVIIEAIEQGIYDVVMVEAILRHFTNGEQSLFTPREQRELNDGDLEIEII